MQMKNLSLLLNVILFIAVGVLYYFQFSGKKDCQKKTKQFSPTCKPTSSSAPCFAYVDLDSLNEKIFAKYLYAPQMSDVDLFLRSSGEQRTSNFLMWQSAYAEMVFMDVLWPDADRRTLWRAIEIYAERERRFGKA